MRNRRPFGLAAILLLASVGATEAAGFQCLAPLRPTDGSETGGINEIVEAGNGARVIRAENGLFWLDAAGLTTLGYGRIGFPILGIVDAGNGTLLIGWESGLYRLDAAGSTALLSAEGMETGAIRKIVDAGNGTGLMGTENGLYRLDAAGVTALVPADGGETGNITRIVDAGNGAWLITTSDGLFRLDAAGLAALRPADGDATGAIEAIVDAGNSVRLIGADSGLYRLDAAGLTALHPADGSATGIVWDIIDAGNGGWLIGAENGLYRLDAAGLTTLRPEDGGETGNITRIVDAGNGAWLITTSNGLFRLDAAGLTALRRLTDPTEFVVWRIFDAGNGARLVEAGNNELYWHDAAGLTALRPADGSEIAAISEIVDAGNGAWLIGAENGLCRLDAAGLTALRPLDGGETDLIITQIVDATNGAWLIGALNGLYRLDAAGLTALRPADGRESGAIDEIEDVGNSVRLIGARNGLYRLDAAGLTALLSTDGRATGRIGEIEDAGNGARLIRAANGLYWLDAAKLPVLDSIATRTDALNNTIHTFAWLIRHPCVDAFLKAELIGVRFSDSAGWQTAVVQRPGADGRPDVVRVEFPREVRAKRSGETLTATLGFRPTKDDAFEPIPGSETIVKVGWGPLDHAMDLARRVLPWGVAAQTVLFGGLLLAARRSRAAWEVVTDPVWGKVGIQFWTLLRFWPRLQRWALARWRDALGKAYPAADYLPMPLAGPQGAAMTSSELAGALKPGRRIWLQGAAGMGKTALVEHAVADWCEGASDLAAAFARCGYVPLPIALRDFAAVPVPDAPEDWIFDLAGRRLEAAGLRVEDARLLRGMLTAGYWVLVLDGANEVDDKGAVQQFARRFPQVGMLVTSQAEPRAEAAGLFEVWRLPETIRAATGPLLELYLGRERGAEVHRRLEAAPISGDIRSGYDVRLVADLVRGGTDPWALPPTRVELYDAMLKAAGKDYPVADLCRVAWSAWIEGRRDLRPGDNIPAALLEPLKQPGVRVVRTQDGESWQFRHDQMRGYLAARWAAVEEVSSVDLFEKTPAIWRLGKSEQQVVWEFFARQLREDANRTVLAWADEEAERAELQVALRRAWRSRVVGWRPPRDASAGGPGG